MANLTLGFLGSLQAAIAGEPIGTFESDKSRALLAYLAVESSRPHRREALVGLLWPDLPEETARRNLRQALYNLRAAIGDHAADPPFLLISRDDIQFNRDSDHILDVAEFNSRLAATEAHSHSAMEACDICAPSLKEAAALYRGRFLQEFFLQDSAEFEEWALVQRESLHRRAVEALVRLANYYEQRAEYEEARVFALRQLELEPWTEEAHRQVMRLLAAAGQRSAALAQFETCRRVLAKELGVEPSTETMDLYERIKRGEQPARGAAPPAASAWSPPPLPFPPTPFVGRDKELEELAGLLAEPECRLLTLLGPGGIGKTRLALQAAVNQRERFRHGAVFVALAGVEPPTFLISTLADALGFSFSGPADPAAQLLSHLRNKEALLILDNVENLLAASPDQPSATGLLADLLEGAPGIKLLATSRELLNMQQEWVYQVEGLDVPDEQDPAQVERSSAAALFLQRARRAQVGFQLEEEERPTLARICRLVGGTPLGLELAAAWVRTLSLAEIEQEIARSLDFLATSMRDLPERHRSMRAVFDQSWRLLSGEERGVLRRLSVFHGGFRREAAENIAGATLSVLSTLQSKSLLRRVPGGRYDLDELVWQYADYKLAEAPGESEVTRERHAAYYLALVEAKEKQLKSARQIEALREMSEEAVNVRAAWRHVIDHGRTAALRKQLDAFWLYYEMRGGPREAKTVLGRAAEELEGRAATGQDCDEDCAVVRASLRAQQGWFCIKLGDMEEARALIEPSIAELEPLGATGELMHAIHYLWALEWVTGHLVNARNLVLRQLDLALETADPWEVAFAQGTLGRTDYMLGDYSAARERIKSSATVVRSLNDPGMIALFLCYLGAVEVKLGLLPEAQTSLQESASLTRALNDRWSYGKALAYLGELAHAKGDRDESVRMLRDGLAIFEEMGARHDTATALNALGHATLDLGTVAEAQQVFSESLALAAECRFVLEGLEALLGIAECRFKNGALEQSLSLLLQICRQPSGTPPIRSHAERLRAQIESQLTPEQVVAAQARTREISFEQAVTQVLQPTQ